LVQGNPKNISFLGYDKKGRQVIFSPDFSRPCYVKTNVIFQHTVPCQDKRYISAYRAMSRQTLYFSIPYHVKTNVIFPSNTHYVILFREMASFSLRRRYLPIVTHILKMSYKSVKTKLVMLDPTRITKFI
jgi:hypothetical protein